MHEQVIGGDWGKFWEEFWKGGEMALMPDVRYPVHNPLATLHYRGTKV